MSDLSPLAKQWLAQMTQAHSKGGWTITPEEAEKVIGSSLADGVSYDEYVALTEVLDRSETNERAILQGLGRWSAPLLSSALRNTFNHDRLLQDAHETSVRPSLSAMRDVQLRVIPSPSADNSNTIELANADWKFRLVVEHEPHDNSRPRPRDLQSLLDRDSADSVRLLAFHKGTLVVLDRETAREIGQHCEALIDQASAAGAGSPRHAGALILKIARILQGPPSQERIAWRLHHPNQALRAVGEDDIMAMTGSYFPPARIPWMQSLLEDPQVENKVKFMILYSWAHIVRNGDAKEYRLEKAEIVRTLCTAVQHGSPEVQNVALVVLQDLPAMQIAPQPYLALLDHPNLDVIERVASEIRHTRLVEALPKLRALAAIHPKNFDIEWAIRKLEEQFRPPASESPQPRRD